MSASAASPLLSPSLSNKHDPSLKPNPHPYAIKTTHSGNLSRSNSSGPNTHSRYIYTPPPGTPTRSPTKPTHEHRLSHRHSASLTSELPLPLPSPLASPARSTSEDDVFLRRQRADTLPTYLVNNNNDAVVPAEPEEDLPRNPKAWTPSQLSVYLMAALHVRSGARLPERVARDITSWVRREAVTGRAFLRWTDEDLKALGVNTLWRGALLAAARNLRQNMLRGRIWGTPEPEQEEQNGSSPDLPLPDADVRPSSRSNTNTNGHVRGMVDKWERGSASSSRSSSRSSTYRQRSESDADTFSPAANGTVRPLPPLPFPSKDNASSSEAEVEEPSIEDLLAAEPPLMPMDGSWGARAWEELDIGVTVRRVEHDTVVPRRNGSANGSGSGSAGSGGSRVSEGERARRTVVDIFADPVDVDTSTADAGVQVDARPDDGQAEAEARERALEDESRETRTLLEEFRSRLEVVEARVGALEDAWRAKEAKAVEVPPTPTETTSSVSSDTSDDADSDRAVVGPGVGLGPETVSALPSYVFLVGLGVCTVVLQVVLKRVAGRIKS